MPTWLRKIALTAHVVFSVGWLGAVVAYLGPAIASFTSRDIQVVRACYLSMELIGWYVIIPLAIASLVTGLIQSLGTEWGIFRHYWISAKFALTVVSVFILLRHVPNKVSEVARLAADANFSPADLGKDRFGLVLHPALGLLVLFTNTVLSIYKPWGLTPYGRRKQQERRRVSQTTPSEVVEPTLPVEPARPAVPVLASRGSGDWWAKVVGAHVLLACVLVFVFLHLNGGFHHH